MVRRGLAMLWATSTVVVAMGSASAQTPRRRCPDVDAAAADDPAGSAEQALCWYERDRSGATECTATVPGSSACVAEAARWCEGADLEIDPQVPNACFMAHVRERAFDEAARIAPLLVAAWREVEPCRAAVTLGVTVEVTTAPEGGVILQGGQRVGETRAQVRLVAPFWRQAVSASFGDVRTDVTPEQLLEAFDTRTCVMRPLRIERPAERAVQVRTEPLPPPARVRRRTRAPQRTASLSVPGLLAGAGGVALAGVGSTLLVIANGTASDLSGQPDGTPWSSELRSDYDSVGPMRLAGGVLLGLGAVSLGVGAALLLAPRRSTERSGDRRRASSLSIGSTGDQIVLSGEL